MATKKITIEQLTEGYLIIAESGEQYAKESANLMPWLEKFFEIPHEETKPEIQNIELVKTAPAMRPEDLKIMPFDYDLDKMQKYKSLSFQEMPDGKVVLNYIHSKYYTSKIAVMEIPYPIPKGYFNKENGWSSSIETAFKLYRTYLAENEDHDRIYRPFGLSKTQVDRDQEYTKIEGDI